MRALRVAATMALLLLPGCTLVEEPPPREISGPTDGYSPTASYLKVHVKVDDGTVVLADFDRRDWYTAEIARRVEERRLEHLTFVGKARIPGEYIVDEALAPADLAGLRYDEMGASPEQRGAMDREHDELLERVLGSQARDAPKAPAAPDLPDLAR